MKYLLILASLIISIAAHAMSCPSNGSIIVPGGTLQNILQTCGQPTSTENTTKTIKISQQWVYYKPVLGNQTNSKVTILFNHDQVANIHLDNSAPMNCQTTDNNNQQMTCASSAQDLTSTGICGQLIQIGNSTSQVLSACGNPAQQTDLQTQTIQITNVIYDGAAPNTLVFEDGKLTSWK